jgi:hypothetical protein
MYIRVLMREDRVREYRVYSIVYLDIEERTDILALYDR